jgi:serine/threonine protein kinase
MIQIKLRTTKNIKFYFYRIIKMQRLTEKQIEKIKFKSQITDKKLDQLVEELPLTNEGGNAKIYKFIGFDGNAYILRVITDILELYLNNSLYDKTVEINEIVFKLNLAPKLYKVKVINNVEYKIFDYVDGLTLEDYIKTHENYYDILDKIIDGLQLMHKHHIVHNDLTLRNIMVDRDKNVYFIDFDISIISNQVEDYYNDYQMLLDQFSNYGEIEENNEDNINEKDYLYLCSKIEPLWS